MSRTGLLAFAAAAAAAAVAAVLAAGRKRHSGSKPSRKQLDRLETVVLKNRDGVEVHITPVGASIQRFILPLGNGERQDVVLGFNKASTYAVSVHVCHAAVTVHVPGSSVCLCARQRVCANAQGSSECACGRQR